MTPGWARRNGAALTAIAIVALEPLVRGLVGDGYLGATALLATACGLALLRTLPVELGALSVKVAVVPALGLSSFAALLTTASLVGIPLDQVSIRLVVASFVVPVAALSIARGTAQDDGRDRARRAELLVLLGLVGIVAFAVASSWDIAYPFQPRGTDWGHYLLYADEAAAQGHLLIDDPYAGEDDRVFADPPAVGAVYGSALLLDRVSSWSLTAGLVVIAGLTVLSVYAAAAALWGRGAGLVAAGAWAVAPIRLDPMYWHGLGTTLAMVFVPLVVLSLGLLYRGSRGWRHALFLALVLLGIATAHSTSAVVVAVSLLVAPLVDLAVRLVRGRSAPQAALGEWWNGGIVRTLLAAVGLACVLGAGVLAHLVLQGRALGRPVDYRFLDPHWLDRASVEGYYGIAFLVLSLVAVVLVLTSGRLRRDRALLALASLALACVAISQLWRAHVAFDYQRVVYYLGVALVLLIGLAFLRRSADALWIAAFVLVLVYVARTSVGLQLPARVLQTEPRAPAFVGLTSFRRMLDRGVLPEADLLVSDGCLHFAVPYLVRRPTIPAFSARQVGFADRLPLAQQAATVLAGGPEGASVAARLGVGYAVADPECAPGLAARLGGTAVVANEDVVVVRLPEPG